MNGILVINKYKGYTSRDIVNLVSKELQIKKIGHAGTLDPLATGVLVLAINEATKIIEFLTYDEKEYIAEVKCGLLTDTLDITGKVLQENSNYVLEKEKLIEILHSFVGKYMQEVPKYSAVKVKGKRLYEYARKNIKVDLPKKEVEIKFIQFLSMTEEGFIFKVQVSKGTYIRSLIRDIGDKLGIFCTMCNLQRTKEGIFDIKNSYTIDEIKSKNYKILSIKEALSNYYQIEVKEELYLKIKNGNQLKDQWNVKDICVFIYKKKVIGIYQKQKEILKARKIFPF